MSTVAFVDHEEALERCIQPGWYLQDSSKIYTPIGNPFGSEQDALIYLENLKLQAESE